MTLEEIQRQMAAAVMTPLTADEEMQQTAADGRPMADVAASFIAPNSRLTAFERLELYNRQYWLRIMGALAEDFMAVRALVGPERFHALSIAYLTEHPSRSFTLRNLGSKLVDWLIAHPQGTGRRHALAVDLARIEWAFVEAFDNPERTPLTLDQIATLDADSHMALQPHVQLLELEFPADEIALALHAREKRQTSEAGVTHGDEENTLVKLPRVRRRPTWVAAHRVDLNVYYRRMEREEYLTLRAIRDGRTLADALDTGFSGSSIAARRRPQRVQKWFATWAELGWLCARDLEPLAGN
jgi:hypothetical protein